MKQEKMLSKPQQGWLMLLLSSLAFAGLGLEMLIAFVVEPLIYGYGLDVFTQNELALHWIITCLVWLIVIALLLYFAKVKLNFDVFSTKGNIPLLNWGIIIALLIVTFVISYIDWRGFKFLKEFNYHGPRNFTLQYVYYLVETMLVYLIIVFAQEAGEKFFSQKLIPYGGIVCALTWGIIHMLTQGTLLAGILSFVVAIFFGVVYVASEKKLYLAFPFIFLMLII